MRLEEARRDPYRRLAKAKGYRSRAAFKLKQINERFKLFRKGDVVIDLGCAPGGWLQVAGEAVGPKGLVVGVDLKEVPRLGDNIITLVGDIGDPDLHDRLESLLPRRADVALSDLSPNVSGVWSLDHLRQIELSRQVLALLPRLLRPGGWAVIKAFEGESLQEFVREVKARFKKVTLVRPPATRAKSSEVYLVAKGFLGGGHRPEDL